MSAREKIIEAIRGIKYDEAHFAEYAADLADAILAAIDDQPFHTIELRQHDWTIKHPLDCRDDLFGCEYNHAARGFDGPPKEGVGVYKVALDGSRRLVIEERIS